ncbi:RNA polymerase sigma factor region1.1 domain-containing protein [Methylobacterium sp. J-076]|uniref:RNA polymerase sigma factor region1.1 domain-containing protein n=1 Tax=Methylobacterium sp. J-076 TaxID=2836655 RepID=UPI001FB8821F|nr:RNA polymerase sigma factor region1.1 domain-containing protein [Methylobacterium sp. J-076]MCJ2010944.1 RNA polymerase sigma factor region1.1 domain-containing protein [Methylobacterium sp. J-076]
MAGTIDRATLDRLIARGRERGELTASELQAALPVEALDVDALVLVMLELEEAGVSVEPDALGPRAEPLAAPTLTLPPPAPGVPQPAGRAGGGRGPELGPAAPPTAEAGGEGAADEGVGRVVLLAGLAVVLVLGIVLVLI